MSSKRSKTLSERLADLSTPKPVLYHPDLEDGTDLTAAKVCEYQDESEESYEGVKRARLSQGAGFEDDPLYSGRAVSRRDLDSLDSGDSADSDSEMTDDGESDGTLESGIEDGVESELEDGVGSEPESDHVSVLESDPVEKSNSGIAAISIDSLKEDIAKGKAAKQQLGQTGSICNSYSYLIHYPLLYRFMGWTAGDKDQAPQDHRSRQPVTPT